MPAIACSALARQANLYSERMAYRLADNILESVPLLDASCVAIPRSGIVYQVQLLGKFAKGQQAKIVCSL